jgi:hypothetical protein
VNWQWGRAPMDLKPSLEMDLETIERAFGPSNYCPWDLDGSGKRQRVRSDVIHLCSSSSIKQDEANNKTHEKQSYQRTRKIYMYNIEVGMKSKQRYKRWQYRCFTNDTYPREQGNYFSVTIEALAPARRELVRRALEPTWLERYWPCLG